MNKIVITIIVALVVIIGGASTYFILSNQDKVAKDSTSTSASLFKDSPISDIHACDVLTEKVAKAVLGENLDHPDAGAANASTGDLSVTNCNYATKIDISQASTGLPKSSGVSLLARTAKTQAGADNNKTQFLSVPAGAEQVDGIGDKAFYNPDFRQLNVLKGNNWYIVTYYVDTVTNASLSTDKQLALKMQFK